MLDGEAVAQRVGDKYRHVVALAAPDDEMTRPYRGIFEDILLFPNGVCPYRTKAGLKRSRESAKGKYSWDRARTGLRRSSESESGRS